MKIQAFKIDDYGFYKEPVLVDNINEIYDESGALKPGFVDAEIPQSLNTPKWDGSKWTEGKTDADLLAEAKRKKIDELDQACTNAILSGFDYTLGETSYHFSLSINAQSNFKEIGDMFKEGEITSEKWTVINNETGEIERITLDEVDFTSVRNAGRPIVRDNISKFRDDLQPQVEAATTVDEVKAVKWT